MTEIVDLRQTRIQSDDLALCLGFFDGLHLGHQQVIKTALSLSPNVGVLTFESQIKHSLGQNTTGGLLTTVADRRRLLSELHISYLFPLVFDDRLKNMSPVDFLSFLDQSVHPKYLVCGTDFKFGKAAAGSVETLRFYEPTYGYKTVAVDLLAAKELKVSSSSIIKALEKGDILTANRELGRNYSIAGTVVHGLANGRRLGFVTANIAADISYVIPSGGVYATKITIDGQRWLSMTNIGTHPTLDQLNTPAIETNIFGFNQELYGRFVRLEFLDRIRDEQRFDSLAALTAQLNDDREYVLKHYSK